MADENEVPDDDCVVFSDEPKSKKVKVGASSYLLKEMMGSDLQIWQAFDSTRVKVARNRVEMSPDAFKEYSATLINLCLYDSNGSRVPKAVITKWPSSAITGLFTLCSEMNGINGEGQEQAKKA